MSASGDRLDYSLVGLGGGGRRRELWVLSKPISPAPHPSPWFRRCLSPAGMEWMLFFLPSHLCWCPSLFTAVLPGDCLVASTAIFALGQRWLCSPATKYADQVVMHCFSVLAGRETLQATLNSGGRHRLTQANPDHESGIWIHQQRML